MFSLTKTVANYSTAESHRIGVQHLPKDDVIREGAQLVRDGALDDVLWAALRHMDDSHITRTYPDGGVGRVEVTWDKHSQQFVDPGNNIWMRRTVVDGTVMWTINRRDYSRDYVSGEASRFAQRRWLQYWAMILADLSLNADDGVSFDMHVAPFRDPVESGE